MRARTLGRFVVLIVCYASDAAAHHGNSEYDRSVVLRYEGVVLRHQWVNPHTLTTIATHTPSGEPITLTIEGGPPAVLRTAGATAKSIVAGERVTVVVSPSRRFPNESAYGHEIVKANGTVIPLGASGAQSVGRESSASGARDIFAVWLPRAEFSQQMIRQAGSWELTGKGHRIRQVFTPAMHRHAQCQPMSAPMLMTYPVAIKFERASGRVVIKTDWLGATRTVYLDGRGHPTVGVRFPQGHSTGRWEGNVLVVDTRNFADEVWAGLPTGEGKHLVERFVVSSDGKSIGYSFMLEDPEYLAQPVSGAGEMSYRPDLKIGSADCDKAVAERFLRELR
jgi:hypothetical protein